MKRALYLCLALALLAARADTAGNGVYLTLAGQLEGRIVGAARN